MKKTLLTLTLVGALTLSGCGHMTNGDFNASNVDSEYFKAETITSGYGYKIIRDKNTDVLYLVTYGYNAMAMTPIFNEDGTPKLYSQED